MPTLKVARVTHQNLELNIVLVEQEFGSLSLQEQQHYTIKLQHKATEQGLSGRIVPVWDVGRSTLNFFAPQPWKPFFKKVNLTFVTERFNATLSIDDDDVLGKS